MRGSVDAAVARLVQTSGVVAALVASAELLTPALSMSEAAEAAGLRMVELAGSKVIHEIGQPVVDLVFPVDCVVSEGATEGSGTVEVTTVGCEGVVGLAGLLGATVQGTRAVCRVPGQALLIRMERARRLLATDSGTAAVHAHTRAVMVSLMQRVVCNRAHSRDQRCASWLLQTRDRVGRDTYPLTHATLADMLGVRRATVSDSLADLQRRQAIRSVRGVLTVLDRPALEASACACHQVYRRAFDQPLS